MIDIRVHLIYRALVALQYEIDRAGAEPSAPGPALRLCLAYLYAARADQSRAPFDGFWKALVEVDTSSWTDADKAYCRRTALDGFMLAIVRSLGFPTTPGLLHKIALGSQAPRVRSGHVASFWREVENYHLRGVPARKRPVRESQSQE